MWLLLKNHYNEVIMGAIASQITNLAIVYSTVYSDADQRKHQSSASLAFVRGIHRRPVNSPHKWPVTRKMFPFDDVIMFKWFLHFGPSLHRDPGGFSSQRSVVRMCHLMLARTSRWTNNQNTGDLRLYCTQVTPLWCWPKLSVACISFVLICVLFITAIT